VVDTPTPTRHAPFSLFLVGGLILGVLAGELFMAAPADAPTLTVDEVPDGGTVVPACYTPEGPPPCWWDRSARGGERSYLLLGDRLIYLDEVSLEFAAGEAD
jgi:hypothetical protein